MSSTLIDPSNGVIMHKKKVLSVEYGQCITRFRVKSRVNRNSLEFNGLLLGDFEPDVRPFEWPRRKRIRRRLPTPEQPMLWDEITWE